MKLRDSYLIVHHIHIDDQADKMATALLDLAKAVGSKVAEELYKKCQESDADKILSKVIHLQNDR